MIGWAHNIMLTKDFRYVSPLQVNLHLGITSSIVSGLLFFVALPGAPLSGRPVLSLSESFQTFSLVGVSMCLSSLCYIGSMKVTKKSGAATIVGFTAVVLGYFISIFRYGEVPNVVGLAGSLSILVGLVLVLLK